MRLFILEIYQIYIEFSGSMALSKHVNHFGVCYLHINMYRFFFFFFFYPFLKLDITYIPFIFY